MLNWIERTFKIISLKRCSELNLTHIENIYGDFINKINCRSIWTDLKGRRYRCSRLYYKKI